MGLTARARVRARHDRLADACLEDIRAAVKHMDRTYEIEQRKTRNTLIAANVVAAAAIIGATITTLVQLLG